MSKILSIEIEDKIIKIIEVQRKGELLSVYNFICIDVPDGIIDNGKILNINILSNLIEKKLIENNIKSNKAILIINTNSIIIRNVVLPYINSKKETASMVKFELEQFLSADLKEYKLIYKTEDIFINDGIKKAKFIVNCLPLKIYEQYIKLFKNLKLELLSFDSSFNCLSKITHRKINNKILDNNKPLVFCKLNNNTMTFSVVKNGVVNFSRISYLNFEDIYEIESVSENIAVYQNSQIMIKDIDNNLRDNYTNLVLEEINKYKRYYSTINKDNKIKKIYIYGSRCSTNMESMLSEMLDIKIEMINDMDNIEIKNESLLGNFNVNKNYYMNEYFNLLLSQCYDKCDINFLTDKNKHHKLLFNVGVTLMAAVLIVLLIFMYHGLNYFINNSALKKEIEIMNSFIENEENIKLNTYVENIKHNISKLESYKESALKLSEFILNEDLINTGMLTEIKKAMPNNTVIRANSIDVNGIQMICNSNSMKEISLFEYNLKNIEFISSVHISSIEIQNEVELSKVYSYSIVCNLRGAGNEVK